jgi:microcin C transport system substrate-binding protein
MSQKCHSKSAIGDFAARSGSLAPARPALENFHNTLVMEFNHFPKHTVPRTPHHPGPPGHPRAPRPWFPAFPAIVAALLGLLSAGCERPDRAETRQEMYPPVEVLDMELEDGGEANPLADPAARKGGIITTWGSGFPKSFNYWIDSMQSNAVITGLMYETLAALHPTEDRYVGILADHWEISEDMKEFIFHINPNARWSDGQPITAEDVQFYYDTIMETDLAITFRTMLKTLNRPEIIDEHTLRITSNEVHWRNFDVASGMAAFPKHAWEGQDFSKMNDAFAPVSGPYRWYSLNGKEMLTLQRRSDWWGLSKKINQNQYNFDYIRFRFVENRNTALEMFKRGEMDLYAIYTAAIWAEDTHFPEVAKNHVIRQKVYNREPIGFQGFAMNMRRPLFQDPKVREALAYLLNRELLNEKIMFNEYFLLNSYYTDLFPDKKNPNATMYNYNPDKARQLLEEAGWVVNDKGILEKDGQPFKFTILNRGGALPHFNVYQQDLKKVGLDVEIENVDQATFFKQLETFDYDMAWVAMGAGRLRDPEMLWESELADQKNSSNYAGVRDEEIDRLIKQQETMMDLAERNEVLKEIDNRLTGMVPMVLLWMNDSTRLLYWNKFGMPENLLGKYSNEFAALQYWWIDPVKAQALEEAIKTDTSLPDEPDEVRYSAP